jgi:hypothetical protein
MLLNQPEILQAKYLYPMYKNKPCGAVILQT